MHFGSFAIAIGLFSISIILVLKPQYHVVKNEESVLFIIVALLPIMWEAIFVTHGGHGFGRQMYAGSFFPLLIIFFNILEKRVLCHNEDNHFNQFL